MKQGTFYVTSADAESAVIRDVTDGQVHTLSEAIDADAGEIIDATIEAEPPMEVAYRVVELDRTYAVPVEESAEPPTKQAVDTAAEQAVGEVTRHERAGTGEVHVLTVPEDATDDAVADVLDDEATVERAAEMGVDRVEIRSQTGVVSVRYLP